MEVVSAMLCDDDDVAWRFRRVRTRKTVDRKSAIRDDHLEFTNSRNVSLNVMLVSCSSSESSWLCLEVLVLSEGACHNSTSASSFRLYESMLRHVCLCRSSRWSVRSIVCQFVLAVIDDYVRLGQYMYAVLARLTYRARPVIMVMWLARLVWRVEILY